MVGQPAAAAASKVRRRPRDRRRQILHHASELFSGSGFHAVRMEDIAEATGITARALYRHFENKQDLLSHVILDDQSRLLAALDDPAGRRMTTSADLEALLRRLIEASLDSLRLGPLWQREARHLAAADFARVRAGTRRIGRAVCEGIQNADHTTSPFQAEVRAWAAVSIVTSPGHYEPTLARRKLADLLLAASLAAISAPACGEEDTPNRPAQCNLPRAHNSRREQLIAAAVRAFRERGFGGVSLDEFGIAGPAVYRYFDSKADILSNLVTRLQDWTALENTRALRKAVDDATVIGELVRGYIRIAVEATDLLAVAVTEALYLPDKAAERERRIRNDDIAEWARWLRVTRPHLPDPAAQALAYATKTVINDLVRVPHLTQNSAFCPELVSCALTTLLTTELPRKARHTHPQR
ncbi:MAG: TetR family transcriptional regulator [Pseudonocardiaceae bacterium]|nr:TetR family transcriptional regulator [Pseudonocardiaceae bacterium]